MEMRRKPARHAIPVQVEFVRHNSPMPLTTPSSVPHGSDVDSHGAIETVTDSSYTTEDTRTQPYATATVYVTVTPSVTPPEEKTPAPETETRPPGGVESSLPDPPPHQSPVRQRFLTVATMVKNQRARLREWIEFHHMLGVEHFIIYDNDSTDLSIEFIY